MSFATGFDSADVDSMSLVRRSLYCSSSIRTVWCLKARHADCVLILNSLLRTLFGCLVSSPCMHHTHTLSCREEAHSRNADALVMAPLTLCHTEPSELAFQNLNTEQCHFLGLCAVWLFQACLKMRWIYNMTDVCNDSLAHLATRWWCKHDQICQALTSFWLSIVNGPIFLG